MISIKTFNYKLIENIAKAFRYLKRKKSKIFTIIWKILVYLLLISMSYVFIYPFFKMLSLSFMSMADIVDPEVVWIPKNFTFRNYKISADVMKLFGYTGTDPVTGKKAFIQGPLFNSFTYSTVLAVSQTLVSALTGYAFAKYNFKGKKLWFVIILISFIIPAPILLVSRKEIITLINETFKLKLYGTYVPQIVFAIFGQGVNSAILILIFFNFFKMIPNDLYESGKIDGANSLQLFWHITIKLSLTSIVVVFLFSFVWNWNETYVTGFLVQNIKLMPKQLSLFDETFNNSFGGSTSTEHGQSGAGTKLSEAYKMAATIISILPLMIIYFFGQKTFVEGIEKTGITGE